MGSRKVNHGLYERPYGRLPGLGLLLAVCMYLAAVLLVLNRVLPGRLPASAAARWHTVSPWLTGAAPGFILVLLFGAAAKLSDCIVDKAGFLLSAAAAVCRILDTLLPRLGLERPMAVPAAAAALLWWLLLAAAFLLFSVNRENTRDARRCAALTAPFLLLCFFGTAVVHQGASMVVNARLDTAFRGLRLMEAGGQITFFSGIVACVLMGATFLFLRTPTRAILYPKRLTE